MPSRRKHPQLFIERAREPIDAASAVDGDALRGRPNSGPIVHSAYSDDETFLTPGWFTNRVSASLLDGGSPTFAATQRGPRRRDRAAQRLLAARATSMHTDAVR